MVSIQAGRIFLPISLYFCLGSSLAVGTLLLHCVYGCCCHLLYSLSWVMFLIRSVKVTISSLAFTICERTLNWTKEFGSYRDNNQHNFVYSSVLTCMSAVTILNTCVSVQASTGLIQLLTKQKALVQWNSVAP